MIYKYNNCSGLTSITIPNSVTSIGDEAFADCPHLTDVYCYAERVPETESDAFLDSHINYSTLHVPASAIDRYRVKVPWSDFGTIVTFDGDIVKGVKEQNIPVLIQTENGKVIVKGADDDAMISVYGIDGMKAGTTVSRDGQATVSTDLTSGSIAIVKIGDKSVKVVMK